MDGYTKSPRSAQSAFHRSIQPVNVYSKIHRTSSNTDDEEKIYFDGKISFYKLVGFTPILVAITRETVQYISQQFIDTHNFMREAFTRALPYKDIFLQWATRVYFDIYRKSTDYALNQNNAEQKAIAGLTTEKAYNDDYYQSERYDDSDSHSTFSNADTDISSPQHSNSKVVELENEISILKQQLSFVLTQMNIKIPSNATEPIPATSAIPPPPPPPLPANLFKCTETVISRPKQNIPENDANPPQAVPRITEILGDLSKVQLRHVPRSPGGTPCRSRVVSVADTMADAVKNAMDKRRKNLDVSLDESGLNDSWEEEKEN